MKRHYDRRYRLYTDLAEGLRAFWAALPDGAEERGEREAGVAHIANPGA